MIATDIEARDMLVATGVPVDVATEFVELLAKGRDELVAESNMTAAALEMAALKFIELGAERDALKAALDRAVADKQASQQRLAEFTHAVKRVDEANLQRGRGGQHVPCHGDFAGANPTVIAQLLRWIRYVAGEP